MFYVDHVKQVKLGIHVIYGLLHDISHEIHAELIKTDADETQNSPIVLEIGANILFESSFCSQFSHQSLFFFVKHEKYMNQQLVYASWPA